MPINQDQLDRAQEHYDAQTDPKYELPDDEPSEDEYDDPQYPDYDYDYND